jgi:hypothetical protein
MHPGDACRDARRLGELDKMRQEDRRDPVSLPRIGDSEGQLGTIGGLRMKLARATTSSSVPAMATSPVPPPTSSRAARSTSRPKPRKRNQRASSERPRRNAATLSASSALVRRT